MTKTRFDRLADRLISYSGDEERVDELRHHFDDERARGRHLRAGSGSDLRDIASLLPLATRMVSKRFVRELGFWVAGLPFVFMMFVALWSAYVIHFDSWSWAGTELHEFERSTQATSWNQAAVVGIWVGMISAIPAGRRLVELYRQGSWGSFFVPASLISLVIAAWAMTDHLPGHSELSGPDYVYEISARSIMLFFAIAALPVMTIAFERFSDRSTGLAT